MVAVDVIARPLEVGWNALRSAHVFTRRVGPNLTFNIIVTKVIVGPDQDAEVNARVTVGGEDPVEVTESPRNGDDTEAVTKSASDSARKATKKTSRPK